MLFKGMCKGYGKAMLKTMLDPYLMLGYMLFQGHVKAILTHTHTHAQMIFKLVHKASLKFKDTFTYYSLLG